MSRVEENKKFLEWAESKSGFSGTYEETTLQCRNLSFSALIDISKSLAIIADGLSLHRTGKWNPDLEINHEVDNRGADSIDITDENARYYKDKQGNESIHCPHCGCTLDRFACMSHHYCYVCGGKFGNIDLSVDKDNSEEDENE